MDSFVVSSYIQQFSLKNGKRFAFACKTGALCEVTDDSVWKFLSGATINGGDIDFKSLAAMGFAVCSESKELDEYLACSRKRTLNGPLALQVAPTLSCNFACKGCIQGSVHNSEPMNNSVQDAIANFVEASKKDIMLNWYGGEPLLAIDAIRRLTRILQAIAESNSVAFSASMTTNGYMIDERLARELINSLAITSFQVTLDGPEEEHNKRRPLANGRESFARVLESISYLYNLGAEVKVRINIDEDNWNSVENLLSLLKEKGLDELLFTAGMKHGCQDDCSLMGTERFATIFVEFQKLLYKYGFEKAASAHLPEPITNSCMMNYPYGFLIGPNGDVYKCLEDANNPSMAIGNVLDLSQLDTNIIGYSSKCKFCDACSQLPICMGGCPRHSEDNFQGCNVWRTATTGVLKAHLEHLEHKELARNKTMELFAKEAARDEEYCKCSLSTSRESRFSHLGANAPTYSSYLLLDRLFRYFEFSPDSKLLDVGCSTGRVLAYYSQKKFPGHATGIELDPELADRARDWSSCFENLTVKQGNVLMADISQYTDFYMFNPFEDYVLIEFIKKIEREVNHDIRICHMSDGESQGLYDTDRGWELLCEGAIQSVDGIPIFETPQHYSIWTFHGKPRHLEMHAPAKEQL